MTALSADRLDALFEIARRVIARNAEGPPAPPGGPRNASSADDTEVSSDA